ncbi:5'-methylthioadenosine/adenosylhomocysteine nucleosidase [Melaminivora suipulveris]|uniref:adenosylhomocysteine nucleosidase n=1 Tax=Melaminivora suipulveris TaxID=2109913 RepID=A0A2R3QCM9_9BURK|nr:5'-methylthioadenosine/adenosylhomocysteine nucleosidase [Melaminivora suipulveris]AVO49528.1 5'-methylthioadenosine/adenosylhomocysteine nucleosidase [Melaminivora suipulveris]
MTIAILSALPEEQGGLVQALEAPERIEHACRSFWRGRLYGHDLVLALSGIGKVAAASTAATLAERFGVRRMLFTGVAGGVGQGVRIGDTVVASEYLQHDMDASPIFPRWEVPGHGTRLACDRQLTAILSEAANRALTTTEGSFSPESAAAPAARMHCGLMASGDRFVSTAAESQRLRGELLAAGHDVLAVEMEGAAVAQVCRDHGLPFAAVRTISDRADDSAHVDFPHFIRHVAGPRADAIVHGFLRLL